MISLFLRKPSPLLMTEVNALFMLALFLRRPFEESMAFVIWRMASCSSKCSLLASLMRGALALRSGFAMGVSTKWVAAVSEILDERLRGLGGFAAGGLVSGGSVSGCGGGSV